VNPAGCLSFDAESASRFQRSDDEMTTGTIKRLVEDRGFGFIAGDDGKEYLFHCSTLDSAFEACARAMPWGSIATRWRSRDRAGQARDHRALGAIRIASRDWWRRMTARANATVTDQMLQGMAGQQLTLEPGDLYQTTPGTGEDLGRARGGRYHSRRRSSARHPSTRRRRPRPPRAL
jgi:hypothetical protein